MSLLNYNLLRNIYKYSQIGDVIMLLEEFDLFHLLLAGNSERTNAVKKRVPNLPVDFLKWLDVCSGGMFFDTTLLTTKAYDDELKLSFGTYSFYFNQEVKKELSLSDDWFVFAVAIHSDVYFFDIKKKDGKVYQWDIDEFKVYDIWDTFDDWLAEQLQEAIDLIADGIFQPYNVKVEMIDDTCKNG